MGLQTYHIILWALFHLQLKIDGIVILPQYKLKVIASDRFCWCHDSGVVAGM